MPSPQAMWAVPALAKSSCALLLPMSQAAQALMSGWWPTSATPSACNSLRSRASRLGRKPGARCSHSTNFGRGPFQCSSTPSVVWRARTSGLVSTVPKRTPSRWRAAASAWHGKPTPLGETVGQCGRCRRDELERLAGGQHGLISDSNELERQRGITILAKNIALTLAGTKVNIIDTPGHADFGGEVERVLRMADGALLLVDAAEGPLPQTRFVLRKAFECSLRPIVVINKIDRPDARPTEVLNAVFDLFVELDADDATLDFPTIYASGREGVATTDLAVPATDIRPRIDAILRYVPQPKVNVNAPLQMICVTLDYSDYVGRIAIGRIVAGKIRKGQRVALIKRDGGRVDNTVKQLYTFDRLGRTETDEMSAGDICAVVGLEGVDIGVTIA